MPLKIDFPWFINRTDMLYYLSSTNQIHKKTSNFTYQLILTKSQEKPTISPSLYVRNVFRVRDVFGTLRKDMESQEYPYKENIVSLRRTLSHGVYVDSDFMCVNQT